MESKILVKCNRRNTEAHSTHQLSNLTMEFTVAILMRCKVTLLKLIKNRRNTTRRTKILNSRISVSILRMKPTRFKLIDRIKMPNQSKDPKRRQTDESKILQSNLHLREVTLTLKIAKKIHLLVRREINQVKISKILESSRQIKECGIFLSHEENI